MIVTKFDLYGDGRVVLHAVCPSWTPVQGRFVPRAGVVVLPGGAYVMHGNSEGEPVALAFAAKGYNTYLLKYSIAPHAAFPNSVADVCLALKIIREHADKLHQNPDKLALCGFSAGGHVAACAGTMWNREDVMEKSGCTGEEGKPNALILGYPCICADLKGQGRMYSLLQGEMTPEELQKNTSAEMWVGPHTPPTFIWSIYGDTLVPVEHSLRFQLMLAKHNVPFSAHTYMEGSHGCALATPATSLGASWLQDEGVCRWFDDCDIFLRQVFGPPLLGVRQQPFFDLDGGRAHMGVPAKIDLPTGGN